MLSFLDRKRTRNGAQAGMTLEAAVALPVFLYFFLNLLSVIEIYRLQGTLLYALREVGQSLSMYAYAYDKLIDPGEDSGIEALIEDAAFSYLYVKGRVEELAGADYLDNSPLTDGKAGIIYLDSSIMQESDIIDLVLSYQISPLIQMVCFEPVWFHSRYYGRGWTGYAVEGGEEAGEKTDYVYVTEYAEVYHTDRDCSHIRLTITECYAWELPALRNIYGSKYTACEKCAGSERDKYYVAEAGDCYHVSPDCSGLKRNVFKISRAEAEHHYRKCTRCG